MHRWPFSKSKFKLKSNRVNLVAPASPIECLLYLPNVRSIQYKLGLERLTRLGNSNVLRLPLRGRLNYLTSLVGQFYKINTRSVKFSWKHSRIFISKHDKMVYNNFFGKLQILLNHGVPRPILSTKHPSLSSECFVDKIGLENSW